jgi:hypothetical protein
MAQLPHSPSRQRTKLDITKKNSTLKKNNYFKGYQCISPHAEGNEFDRHDLAQHIATSAESTILVTLVTLATFKTLN